MYIIYRRSGGGYLLNFSLSFLLHFDKCSLNNFRHSHVFIRRSHLCLFTSSINTHWICFQRFSTCSFQSMVFNINWFSFCNCCLSKRYRAFINNNISLVSYLSQCYCKVEISFVSISISISYLRLEICSYCYIHLVFFVLIIFSNNESLFISITCGP